jgi:hypothetical protein
MPGDTYLLQSFNLRQQEMLPIVCAVNVIVPITPVSGRAETAGFGAAESGVYSARFWQVFGTAVERPTGGADADAQFS